jgi:WD40 repeat protein
MSNFTIDIKIRVEPFGGPPSLLDPRTLAMLNEFSNATATMTATKATSIRSPPAHPTTERTTFGGRPLEGVSKRCFRGDVQSIARTPYAQVAVASGIYLLVCPYDTKAPSQKLSGPMCETSCVAVLSNGNLIASSHDGSVYEWKGGDMIRSHKHSRDRVQCVAALPDNKWISGGRDNRLCVWDVEGKSPVSTMAGHMTGVESVCVRTGFDLSSEPGSEPEVATAGDRCVRLWTLGRSESTSVLRGHKDKVKCVSFLQDGRVASGSFDTTVQLWDVKSGHSTAVLQGHSTGVTCLTQLEDGTLISGDSSGVLTAWDNRKGYVCTGSLPSIYHGNAGINCICPVGRSSFATGAGKNMHIWYLDLD